MSEKSTQRLTDHHLVGEGVAHNGRGSRMSYWGTGGTGRAKCSCGALSDSLESATKRKQWHRDHKTEIRNQKEA